MFSIIVFLIASLAIFQKREFMQLNQFKNKLGKLRVAPNHRYPEFEDSTPFFYIGDTPRKLLHRYSRKEAQYYLINRTAKFFTLF